MFADCSESQELLQQLAEELSHRRVPSARELRKRVEAAISGLSPQTERVQPVDRELPHTPPADLPMEQPGGNAHARRRARAADYATPPVEFTIVQPLGVSNRPSAFRPAMQNDVRLEIGRSDAPVKVFRIALFALIREMKSRRIGTRQFSLEDGERVNEQSGGFSYQFDFTEEANLFEGAKVDLFIEGRWVAGNITALFAGRILVTIQDDFGPSIRLCVLRIDNTALLQALHDRMQKIEAGEVPAFRAEFAANVLQNAGKPNLPLPVPRWPSGKQPNDPQRKFVGIALANEIAWLWGPPGTGKTDTLSSLVRILYDKGKRILICSNTNQAVDQLLLQLCSNTSDADESALKDGHVLRLGRVEHDELRRRFEEFITVEAIVARKSEGLIHRKATIEAELERLSRSVARAEQILSNFRALDEAESAVSVGEREMENSTTNVQSLAASIEACAKRQSGLEHELQELLHASVLRRMFRRGEEAIRRDIGVEQAKRNAHDNDLAGRS